MKQNTQRPKWAKDLTVKEWRHLKEGRFPQQPTLKALREDAGCCPECALILRSIEAKKA